MAVMRPFSWCLPTKTKHRLIEDANRRGSPTLFFSKLYTQLVFVTHTHTEAAKIEKEKERTKNKKHAKGRRGAAMRGLKMITEGEGSPPCRMALREWIIRIICLCGLVGVF
eukprot:GHVS01028467.1.p2 GENE.GHVS01028467.1~~GHVS01028467.1.p2  ORF type:complete len:111 (+),score=21.90 GHVS01028467.1:322-654(+)